MGTASHESRTVASSARSTSASWGRAWLLLCAFTVAGLGADLISKYVAFRRVADEPVLLSREEVLGNPAHRLPWHEGIRVLPWDLLDFRLVINHGAVFGIGNGQRAVFIFITLFAIGGAVFVFRRWTLPTDRGAHIGLALVLAGGLGNLYDRIVYGAVRDFLHMLPRWHLPFDLAWPGGNQEVFPWVFNLADVFLLTGMVLLLFCLHRHPQPDGHSGTPAG